MNWILASLLMFVFSVSLYLLVRKSTLLKTPSQLNNLAMFLVPLVLYALLAVGTRTSLAVTPYQFLILVLMAFFFAYLGNIASLKSLEEAPNPGYSLIISKSYVVFTSLVSVFLFSSELTLKSVIAIALIVGFSSLVVIDPKQKAVKEKSETPEKKLNFRWFFLSLGAFFAWGMLAITSKYLLNLGVHILSRLIFVMSIVSFLILIESRKIQLDWRKITRNQWILFFLIGVSAAAFNYFQQTAYSETPNIGYVNAINASSIAAVTIGSALFFKDELNLRKMFGILGVISGLGLLLI